MWATCTWRACSDTCGSRCVTHTHTRTHARTRTHTHTHTYDYANVCVCVVCHDPTGGNVGDVHVAGLFGHVRKQVRHTHAHIRTSGRTCVIMFVCVCGMYHDPTGGNVGDVHVAGLFGRFGSRCVTHTHVHIRRDVHACTVCVSVFVCIVSARVPECSFTCDTAATHLPVASCLSVCVWVTLAGMGWKLYCGYINTHTLWVCAWKDCVCVEGVRTSFGSVKESRHRKHTPSSV